MTRLSALESECKKLKEQYKVILAEKQKLAFELKGEKAKLIASEKEKDEILHTKDEHIKNLEAIRKEEKSAAEEELRKVKHIL